MRVFAQEAAPVAFGMNKTLCAILSRLRRASAAQHFVSLEAKRLGAGPLSASGVCSSAKTALGVTFQGSRRSERWARSLSEVVLLR